VTILHPTLCPRVRLLLLPLPPLLLLLLLLLQPLLPLLLVLLRPLFLLLTGAANRCCDSLLRLRG
jgi:hypothetical protein